MILDSELILSNAQAILDSGASESYLDALAAGDAVAPGAKIKVAINTAYVDAGGGTIIATFQTCDEPTFSSPTTLLTGPTITIAAGAATAAGAVGVSLLDAVIPVGLLRYSRVYYTFGAAMDSGAMDAYIVLDSDKGVDKAY